MLIKYIKKNITITFDFFVRPRLVARNAFFLFIFLLLNSCPGLCEEPTDFLGLNNKEEGKSEWKLFADRIVYEKDGLVFLEGNAEIAGENKTLFADYIKYDSVSETALARGNVKMNWGKDIIESEALKLNIKEETGTIFDGHLFIDENHFYIKSSRLDKIGEERYVADQVLFSSCDGEKKDWQIYGKNLDVTLNGYGSVENAALFARSAPLAYSPYFFFPVTLKRQSGLLIPEFGYSTRKGLEYQQPYYWAINDNSDATFYAHSMTLRGVKTGLEYRYVLDNDSLGIVRGEFLDDQKTDNGSPASSNDWGFTHDNFDRQNSDRYWFRMKADQKLSGEGLSAKIDLDFVSDQDYLLELSDRKYGYDDTSTTFSKYFGRQIEGSDETDRLNRVNLSKRTDTFAMNTDIDWYDNVTARSHHSNDETLKHLPRMQFGTTYLPFSDSSILTSLGGSYTDFYSINGKNGDRASIYGEAHSPHQFGNYIIIDPHAGLMQTVWADRTPDRETDKDIHHRTIYNLGINAGSRLRRIYSPEFVDNMDIIHNLEPNIGFYYVPDKDQEVLPDFDGRDIIEKQQNITWSLTNTLIGSDKNDHEQGVTRFSRLCRLYFEQGYDVNKAEEKNQKPFTPIKTELSLSPYPNFVLEADAKWSVYDYDFVSHNIKMIIKNDIGHAGMVEYRNTRKDLEAQATGIESFKTGLEFALTSYLKTYGSFEKDILNGKTIETVTGIRYFTQCWATDINYADKGNEEKISILFSLTGLGDLGVSAPQL